MSRINIEDSLLSGVTLKQGMRMGITRLGDADATLDLDMGPIISITPGAARVLTIPAFASAAEAAAAKGLVFYVINAAAFTVTVRTSTPATIGIVPATVGATGMFVCLGDTALGVGGWSGGL